MFAAAAALFFPLLGARARVVGLAVETKPVASPPAAMRAAASTALVFLGGIGVKEREGLK